MNRWMLVLLFSVISIVLISSKSRPCTSFSLNAKDKTVVGKNYDWPLGEGLLIVNKRGLKKSAAQYRDEHFGVPVHWISKFGSVTFNQFGREFPMGGMNEAGLVVEILVLTGTTYPEPDTRPTISMLQWIQYQLDNFHTTQEVIESDSYLRILPPLVGPGVHYFVCDRSGACATMEFLDGRLVYHTGETMPVKVLANNTYQESLRIWKQTKPSHPNQFYRDSRFARAARFIEDYGKHGPLDPIDYAFTILEKVSQGDFTKWSIVYDLDNLMVYFKTFSNHQFRSFGLQKFDYSCKFPTLMLDINGQIVGDVTAKFQEYDRSKNKELIETSFRDMSFGGLNRKDILNMMIRYPDENVCIPY